MATVASFLTAKSAIAEVLFNQQVRPIFAEYCLQCHGPDAKQRGGDLRLDVEASAKSIAINLEDRDKSELIQRITSVDDETVMPPRSTGKSLTSDQKHILSQWVREGAEYQGHWAFEPIRKPSVPRQDLTDASPIDRFLLDKLENRKLHYSPILDRTQLIRRVSFDLVGLPPTWEEVESFVNDTSSDAYARLINRILDSPRYGERWGRHWLDLARYADTYGGAAIGFKTFPFSYTYRDYVIGALNDDVPYNRFLVEQIAADELDLGEKDPRLSALGFLTVGMQFRNLHDTLDDQIDVLTRGLMGLTVACARCHDHKFDAIPTRDYYSIYASLAPSKIPDRLPVIGDAPEAASRDEYQRKLQELQWKLDDFVREQCEVMRSRLRMQVGPYLKEIAKGATEQDLSTEFLSYRTDDIRPLILNRWRDYLLGMSETDPVFGPWVKLRNLDSNHPDSFRAQSQAILKSLSDSLKESGWTADKQHSLGGEPPRWNPKVLESLETRQPSSMVQVAEAYGGLFADVYRQWMQASQKAALEGLTESSVVPDEAAEHETVNSPTLRQLRHHLVAPGSPTVVSDDVATRLTNRTINDLISGKRNAIHELHLTSPGSPPRAMVLYEEPLPKEYRIFERGNPLARGELVKPGFLSAVPVIQETIGPGKRRLALANAITSDENPLTRRVFVNWVWQHHFGQGLVRTSDDFGTRGKVPTHPELLDYLAEVFREQGWSIKRLHRTIMLSQAYQQGSVENEIARNIDPENDLLWRMPRRRLDFESMRDAMLSVSKELDTSLGGRPIDLNATPAIPRRSIYGFINRDIVSSLMSTFDGANPNSCTAKRPETTVPQQSLFALNSDFIQDRASKLQSWLTSQENQSDDQRIVLLFRRIFARNPKSAEIEMALKFVHRQSSSQERPADFVERAWCQLAHALLASNEFVFLD